MSSTPPYPVFAVSRSAHVDEKYRVVHTTSGPVPAGSIVGDWLHKAIEAASTGTGQKISLGIVAGACVSVALAAGQLAMPKLNLSLSTVLESEYDPGAIARAVSEPAAVPMGHAAQAALAGLISDDWDIEQAKAEHIVTAAVHAGAAHHVDPLLVLGVIAQESDFTHRGNAGIRTILGHPGTIDPMKPHGLMQVSGELHAEHFPGGKARVTSDATNIRIGTTVLQEYLIKENGNVARALQRYNGNPTDISHHYATKVLEYQSTFRTAAVAAQRAEQESMEEPPPLTLIASRNTLR